MILTIAAFTVNAAAVVACTTIAVAAIVGAVTSGCASNSII